MLRHTARINCTIHEEFEGTMRRREKQGEVLDRAIGSHWKLLDGMEREERVSERAGMPLIGVSSGLVQTLSTHRARILL